MTRFLPVIPLLLLCQITTAQILPTLEPTFLRPGVLYRAPGQLAPYAHAWVGMIAPRLVLHAYNAKIGVGASYTVHNAKERSSLYLFAGMNAQNFWQVREGLALDRIHRVSIECGIGVQSGRVTVIALTDPDNWETCFGVRVTPRWRCNVKGRRDVCHR